MYEQVQIQSLLLYAASAFAILFSVNIMGIFGSRNKFVVDGRTTIITGGSQGMGLGLAKKLAAKGAHVVIVARDVKKLESALSEIKSRASNPSSQRFHYISADLTSAAENTRVLEEVTAWNNGNPPDIVWANAGSAYPHLFLETDVETMRRQMDTNYWAAAYLAHATLKAWTQPTKPGNVGAGDKKVMEPRHFIITSSVLAFCGVAGYVPYSPAKSALRSLADTLRSEIQLYNGARFAPSSPTAQNPEIKIHIVAPGTITTPGHKEEQRIKHPVTAVLEEDDPAQTGDEVAAASIKGLEKGGYLITTQFLGHLMRAGNLGGSPRNGWIGIRDTLLGCIVYVAYLFINPDMERKVYAWGKKNGVQPTATLEK